VHFKLIQSVDEDGETPSSGALSKEGVERLVDFPRVPERKNAGKPADNLDHSPAPWSQYRQQLWGLLQGLTQQGALETVKRFLRVVPAFHA